MNRRTLLRGAVAGSIVSATNVATVSANGDVAVTDSETDTDGVDTGDGTDTNGADTGDSPVILRIVEIPDAVTGGELLGWTVEVENPTDQPVRPTVEYTVDGASYGTSTLTVGPGATERPTAPSYQTEPVATEDEVTVRVDANGESDERTVRLLPADELDETLLFPERELTVRPGTTVHFEVGAVDPDAFQTTTWWVDGERVGDSIGPWEGVYFAEQDAHFRQETFETQGTYEVAASVDVDGELYRASWTVTVAPDGLAGPTIEAARPEPGVLEVDPDEPTATALEIDVADPDGNLDRVVWWLTQADEILDVTDVSGASDTATLTVDDGLCHTCLVVPWVITSDGTFTSNSLWQIDRAGMEFDEPGDGSDEPGVEPGDPRGGPDDPRTEPGEPGEPGDEPSDPRTPHEHGTPGTDGDDPRDAPDGECSK